MMATWPTHLWRRSATWKDKITNSQGTWTGHHGTYSMLPGLVPTYPLEVELDLSPCILSALIDDDVVRSESVSPISILRKSALKERHTCEVWAVVHSENVGIPVVVDASRLARWFGASIRECETHPLDTKAWLSTKRRPFPFLGPRSLGCLVPDSGCVEVAGLPVGYVAEEPVSG